MKAFIKKILKIRNTETVEDGLSRHLAHIKRRFNMHKISKDKFLELLSNCGIKNGDTLIVHCSWRDCFMLDMSPSEVIDTFIDIIGDDGTLLMPCFPYNKENFNVNEDVSVAGVLSEIFRKRNGTVRSIFPKGTMCGCGKNAINLINGHEESLYEYDSKSPYSKAILDYDAKILLVGMGRYPHKITAFHCGSYDARMNNSKLANTYTKECRSIITKNNDEFEFHYLDRKPGCSNNKSVFRKLFKKTPRKTISYRGLKLISFKGVDAYDKAFEFCSNGQTLYKYSNK